MYPPLPLTGEGTLIFDDRSFIKTPVYQPEVPARDKNFDYEIDTNIDPWMDEIFIRENGQSNPIKPAVTYTCSCPSCSKSILAAPQSQYDKGTRKRNRQKRYPLPTAMGQDRFYGSGHNLLQVKLPVGNHKKINRNTDSASTLWQLCSLTDINF